MGGIGAMFKLRVDRAPSVPESGVDASDLTTATWQFPQVLGSYGNQDLVCLQHDPGLHAEPQGHRCG